MLTIVIAAFNEESVIGACLDALLAQPEAHPERIYVSANGCSDRTAAVAAMRGVRVIDRAEPGKPAAMNAADAIATGFPRVYLDADIVVPPDALGALLAHFDADPSALAVVPRRRIDTAGRPWPVAAYFSINERLPVFRKRLFGRGLIALSEEGRQRFDSFPAMTADDLFMDAQYVDAEKREADDVEIVVQAPHSTKDLVNRLVRVRRGNAQMRGAAADGEIHGSVPPSDRWAWLRVVARNPRLAVAAPAYVAITLVAARRAKRAPRAGASWAQDRSTRIPAAHPQEETS